MNYPRSSAQTRTFLDRLGELKAVTDRLYILHGGGSVFQCVLNFYGILGIGKTRLLDEIHQRAWTGKWQDHTLPPTFSALTDLAQGPDLSREKAFMNPYRRGAEILADQMRQLEQQTKEHDKKFFEVLKAFRTLYVPESDDDEQTWHDFAHKANQVASAFSLYVYRQVKQRERQKQPVMLLFDNVDELPSQVFDWLEYEVFSPLVQTDRILLVCAGRSPVRWKRFEVRRRVLLRKLSPPDDGALLERPQTSWSTVADQIVEITFNYPPANDAIVAELERMENAKAIDLETFNLHRPGFIKLMVDVIEEKLLTDVDSDLRQAFRIIAPLRQFDVTRLRAVLPEFDPERFGDRGGNYYLLMLNRMVDTALVEWSVLRKAYVLDETLRRILTLDVEAQNIELVEQIHQQAADLHHSWLEENTESRGGYVVEWLYHRAQVLRLQGRNPLEISEAIRNDLQRVLDKLYRVGEPGDGRLLDSARRLVEEIKRDPDLPALLEQEMIPKLVEAVEVAVPGIKSES